MRIDTARFSGPCACGKEHTAAGIDDRTKDCCVIMGRHGSVGQIYTADRMGNKRGISTGFKQYKTAVFSDQSSGAAAGNTKFAAGIDSGNIGAAAPGNTHASADNITACRTIAENIHAAAGIDGRLTGTAATGNIH